MIESRYEEYVRFNNGIPFVFHDRLVRHDSMGGRMANWHENLELQLCEAGSGSVVLDGRRSTLAIGTVVVVNSNVIHRTDPDGELVYSCVILDSEFCRRAGIDIKTLAFRELIEDEALSRIFGEIRCAYAATDDPCRTARLQALALSLLIILRGRYTQGERGQSEGISSCVKSAIVYIRTHFELPDRRGDERYAYWNEQYNAFVGEKMDLLRREKELNNALLLLHDKDYDIRMAVRADAPLYYDDLGILLMHNMAREPVLAGEEYEKWSNAMYPLTGFDDAIWENQPYFLQREGGAVRECTGAQAESAMRDVVGDERSAVMIEAIDRRTGSIAAKLSY